MFYHPLFSINIKKQSKINKKKKREELHEDTYLASKKDIRIQKIAKNNKYLVENFKIAEKNFFKYLSGYDIVHSSVKFEDIS